MAHHASTIEMRGTWLVQRLRKPHKATGPLAGLANAFAFGGGLRNGGLSDEASGALNQIMSFDYMGAAEFEFGALPKMLSAFAKDHKDLVAEPITIALRDVAADFRLKDKTAPEGAVTVYLLCRKSHRAEVEKRVREMAAKDYTLKESTRLPSTLRPATEYDGETVGWIELDNGFMFFTDREMWAETSALFGVEVSA